MSLASDCVPGGVTESLADLELARAGGVRAARPPGSGVPRGVPGLRVHVHLVPLPLLLPRVLGLRVLLAYGPGVPLDPYPRKLKKSR